MRLSCIWARAFLTRLCTSIKFNLFIARWRHHTTLSFKIWGNVLSSSHFWMAKFVKTSSPLICLSPRGQVQVVLWPFLSCGFSIKYIHSFRDDFDIVGYSALTLLVGRQEGHPACKKTEQWGAGVVICLEQGADLHMAQLMPLPLTVSCFSKIQIDFTFLVPAHPGSPGKRAVKRARACV